MHRTKRAFLLSLLGILMSCGSHAPKADSVENGTVETPNFPSNSENSFALSAETRAHNFSGNFLIWSPNVSPLQVKNIANASVRTRKERSATLGLITEKWLPAKLAVSYEQEMFDLVDQKYRAALTAGFRSETVRNDVTKPTARQWFAKRLDNLVDEAAAGDDWIKIHQADIKRNFAAYCDAKIWEFGVSKLALMPYKERPTPLGLCEDYYASSDSETGKQPYFQDAALCGPATEENGKNYFACMWHTGLFLTPQFKYLVGNTSETCTRGGAPGSKATAITNWATGSPSLLERILGDDATRQKLASVVMLSGSIPASTPDAIGKIYPDLKSCQLAFRRLDFDRTSRLDQASPGRLLAIGESDGVSVPQYPLDLIPRRVPSDEAKDAANYQSLTRLVRMFGWRITTDDGYSVSVSDLLFNQPVAFDLSEKDPSQALQRNKDAIIPDDASRADPAFRIFVEIKNQYVSSVESQRAAAMQAVLQAKDRFQGMESLLATRATLDQELSVEGLKAVNAPLALTYFHTFGLRLLKDENHLTASLSIGYPVTSCIDIKTSASCIGLSVSDDDIKDAQLTFDPMANKLVIRTPLNNLSAHGMAPMKRSLADLDKGQSDPLIAFNDIPAETLQGRTLEVVMYGNRLGQLEFFTGDIFILDPTTGEKILTGSLNGDLFDETRRELLADDPSHKDMP